MLCFLYGPALTSVHDYWKDYSLDYVDICQQSDVFAFNTLSRFVIAFLLKSKCLLNFLPAVTIHSDFGTQENKICHCFYFFPIYLPFTFYFHALEKEMATHSSVLAWRIPGMEEPDGLPSMGSHRVGHD